MESPPETSTGDEGLPIDDLAAAAPSADLPADDVITPADAPPGSRPPNDPFAEAAGEAPKGKSRSGVKTAVEWIVLIGSALLIALLIKTFLFQAFYIPSESMVPTLEKNDRVLVNKLSYKAHPVHRGDIVVFKAPRGPDGKLIDPTVKDLVKRVIGLPGEMVSAHDGEVYINGKPLEEKYLPDGTRSDCASFSENCFKFASTPIPKDQYWVMGDNRPSSKDSRFFGAIPKSDIVGRVFVRIWPLNRLDLL